MNASSFKKGDVVAWKGNQYIIMASVPSLSEKRNVYNICTDELLSSQFGVYLEDAELVPSEHLREQVRKRALGFL